MSIVRDYAAEKEWELLKWLGESIQELEALLPPGAATAVTSTPQEEPALAKSETAGLGRPFEDVQ